jgi:hypothetical protein
MRASSLRAMLHEQVVEKTLRLEPAEVEALVSGVSEEDTWQPSSLQRCLRHPRRSAFLGERCCQSDRRARKGPKLGHRSPATLPGHRS